MRSPRVEIRSRYLNLLKKIQINEQKNLKKNEKRKAFHVNEKTNIERDRHEEFDRPRA